MKCPKCKLESPPDASRCDCGWDFSRNIQAESLLPVSSTPQVAHPLVRRGRLLALGGLLVAWAIGALRQFLPKNAIGLLVGVLGDAAVVVLFAGLATWAVGAVRSRRGASHSYRVFSPRAPTAPRRSVSAWPNPGVQWTRSARH